MQYPHLIKGELHREQGTHLSGVMKRRWAEGVNLTGLALGVFPVFLPGITQPSTMPAAGEVLLYFSTVVTADLPQHVVRYSYREHIPFI